MTRTIRYDPVANFKPEKSSTRLKAKVMLRLHLKF